MILDNVSTLTRTDDVIKTAVKSDLPLLTRQLSFFTPKSGGFLRCCSFSCTFTTGDAIDSTDSQVVLGAANVHVVAVVL